MNILIGKAGLISKVSGAGAPLATVRQLEMAVDGSEDDNPLTYIYIANERQSVANGLIGLIPSRRCYATQQTGNLAATLQKTESAYPM